MIDITIDTMLDTLKLIPFLLTAFFIIELLEHKLKSNKKIKKAGKLGPFIGSILGAIPQCGFATMATNLYVTRIISLGTLIAIYLSTSDEMLPIMLSEQVPISFILKTILLKVIIGIFFGFLIDLIYQKKIKANYHICEEEHCHCNKNIYVSVIKHTFNITSFILIINFILNSLFYIGAENILSNILLKNTIFETFLSSLIGLIPNCGSSVILTKLYLSSTISYGAMLGGLLTNCGISIVILFKSNKNLKENFFILSIIYLIGSIMGLIINFMSKLV